MRSLSHHQIRDCIESFEHGNSSASATDRTVKSHEPGFRGRDHSGCDLDHLTRDKRKTEPSKLQNEQAGKKRGEILHYFFILYAFYLTGPEQPRVP